MRHLTGVCTLADSKFIRLPKDLSVMGNVKHAYILLAALTQTIERFK